MPLPFAPACLPLLIGSLPQRGPSQALELSRRYAGTLLTWPQLPRRSFRERGLAQAAFGFPGLVIDVDEERVYVDRARAESELDRLALAYLKNDLSYGALGEAEASGLSELLRQRETLRNVRVLKGQCLGPISLALQLTDERERPLIYDEVMFDALLQHLRLRVAWQEAQIGALSSQTIVCLDEPLLEILGQPFLPVEWDEARQRIDEVLAIVVGTRAVFAPGSLEWGEVLRTSVELIVADVFGHGAALLGAAEALGGFFERGGVVGLGIVPSEADELARVDAEALLQRLDALLAELERAGVARELVLRRAVVTPNGGLWRLEPELAEGALQLLATVSGRLRERYGMQ